MEGDCHVEDGQLVGNPVFFCELKLWSCLFQAAWDLSFWGEGEHDKGVAETVHEEDHDAWVLSFSDGCSVDHHGSRGGGGDHVWPSGERMENRDMRQAGSMLDHFDTGLEDRLGCLSPIT